MAPPDNEHDCQWHAYANHLQGELEKMRGDIELLRKQVFGKKSEKMPPAVRAQDRGGAEEKAARARRRRKENAVAKSRLLEDRIEVPVPEAERSCPHCGHTKLRAVGGGKESTEYDYVPGYFRRRVTVRETLSCACGEYIVTAPAPDKVCDKLRYTAGFIAHLIVSKCADSIPLYRLEKQYRRLGIPIARSTMCDLFHRAAELLSPIGRRLLWRIAQSDVVGADETPIAMQGTDKRAFLWTFLAGDDIGYVFSRNRSGKTPSEVLGGSTGTLVVDAYTGYNRVTDPGGRTRAGCLAHARRKIFEAKGAAPEMVEPLEWIHDLYLVEHEVKERGIVGSPEHLAMRRARSRPLMAKLLRWLHARRALYPPKGLPGRAVGYGLKNWRALTRFVRDPRVPIDNNASERALRVVALGRKNFLFVGNEDAGDNIATLYSLVATCEAHGKNPIEYLRDVLGRVGSHPQSQIDDLLPDRWAPAS